MTPAPSIHPNRTVLIRAFQSIRPFESFQAIGVDQNVSEIRDIILPASPATDSAPPGSMVTAPDGIFFISPSSELRANVSIAESDPTPKRGTAKTS
jgi:hypothetical protein